MYDPIIIPEGVDPELTERLQQYVLTAGEVAKALDVTQQAVAYWTKHDLIDVLVEGDSRSERHRGTNRYSLEGLVARARDTARPVHAYTLPMRLLTDYDVTPLTGGSVECIYVPPKGAVVTEWISESETAKLLNVQRSTLRNHRAEGHLNPELHTRPHPSPSVSGVQYRVDDVKAVREGLLSLYQEPAHA